MNYELGLDKLRHIAGQLIWFQEFLIFEASLRENIRDEKRYGTSEQSKRDRARIVEQLNLLCVKELGVSFNDICLGNVTLDSLVKDIHNKQPKPSIQFNVNTNGGDFHIGDVHNDNRNIFLFEKFEKIVDARSDLDVNKKRQIKQNLNDIEEEIFKDENAKEPFLIQRFKNIKLMAPDIFEVVIATLTNPASGLSLVGRKILKKVKSSV